MKNYINNRWVIEQRQFPSLQIISWLIIANISILWLAQINHFYILLLPLNAICLIYKRFIALVLLVAAILVNFQLQIYALNSDWVTESQAMDEMRVKVTALSRQSEYGFVTTVHNLANNRNYIAYSESALPLHGKCQISGKLQPHKLQATPSQFDQYQYYVANHIVGRIQLDSINCNTAFSLRSSLLRKLQEKQLAQPLDFTRGGISILL